MNSTASIKLNLTPYVSLVFRRKDHCEAKPGYRVGNFDQITMLK